MKLLSATKLVIFTGIYKVENWNFKWAVVTHETKCLSHKEENLGSNPDSSSISPKYL